LPGWKSPCRCIPNDYERGFNQSLLPASHLSKKLALPLLKNGCQRVRNTTPQTTLPWKERSRNVKQAFTCSADLSGSHIAIVDDVMTTGASMNALALTLKRAGASKVSAWVIARTLPDHSKNNHRN
jgi:ComF family protein